MRHLIERARERRHFVAAILARARRQIAGAHLARGVLEAAQPPATGPKISSAAAVVPTATSTTPTTASVGPSCRSADRGIATTTPTSTPSTTMAPAWPARRRWRLTGRGGLAPSGRIGRGPTARPRPPVRAETIRDRVKPRANLPHELVGRHRAVARNDAAVLHDRGERHAALVFLPKELLDVELRIARRALR